MEMKECEAYGSFGRWSVSQQPMTNASSENTYSNTPQAETTFIHSEDDNRSYEPVMRGVQQVPNSRGTHRVVGDEFESRQYCNVISRDASTALEERTLADEVTGCHEPHYMNQSQIALARQQHSNESS